MDVQGKVAVVTGGVRGLGRATARALAQAGARVGVLDTDVTGLREASQADGLFGVECDVTDPVRIDAALAQVTAGLGDVDVLVNNAGILHSAPLVSFASGGTRRHDPKEWDAVITANLSSVFYVTSAVVEGMLQRRTRGVVVSISSVCASGNPGQSAYSASKAGVEALTATWAKELGRMRIRFVAVAPGFSDTPSTSAAMEDERLKETVQRVPLRRLGKPEEIADAVLFAVRNDFLNGAVLRVDGGLVI